MRKTVLIAAGFLVLAALASWSGAAAPRTAPPAGIAGTGKPPAFTGSSVVSAAWSSCSVSSPTKNITRNSTASPMSCPCAAMRMGFEGESSPPRTAAAKRRTPSVLAVVPGLAPFTRTPFGPPSTAQVPARQPPDTFCPPATAPPPSPPLPGQGPVHARARPRAVHAAVPPGL